MNSDMNLSQSWLKAIKLTLSVKKTKYILIGSKCKLSQIHNYFTVKVNNTPLHRVTKDETLGVYMLTNLSLESTHKCYLKEN